MDSLGPGRIFWKAYPGDRGGGKTRPMIVVTTRSELVRAGSLAAVVCSTDFDPTNLLPHENLLPHRADGRCATRFDRPTVAVCDWTVTFRVEEIKPKGGLVATDLLREICRVAGLAFPRER